MGRAGQVTARATLHLTTRWLEATFSATQSKEKESVMRTPYRIAALLMVYVMAPLDIVAQKGTGPSTKSVLFVCEHGTARSLLAKVLF